MLLWFDSLYWLAQAVYLSIHARGPARVSGHISEALRLLVELVDHDEPELVEAWEDDFDGLVLRVRELDEFLAQQLREAELARHRAEFHREMAGADRVPVIQEILSSGLLRIRSSARAGDVETCDVLAESLHNLPVALDDEATWRRWVYADLALGIEAAHGNMPLMALLVRWRDLAANTESDVPF